MHVEVLEVFLVCQYRVQNYHVRRAIALMGYNHYRYSPDKIFLCRRERAPWRQLLARYQRHFSQSLAVADGQASCQNGLPSLANVVVSVTTSCHRLGEA